MQVRIVSGIIGDDCNTFMESIACEVLSIRISTQHFDILVS